MSNDQLFGEESPQGTPPATPPQTDPEKNYLEELVGEDKKFKSAEDLAKGKAQSDAFIEQLKRENEGLRTDLNSRLAVEQFVDQVMEGNKPPSNPQPSSVTTPTEPTVAPQEAKKDEITPEQINQLVEQTLETRLSEQKRKDNVATAMQAAVQKFGQDNFRSKLSEKARELGLGEKFLADVAEQNPATFMNLMGLNETASEQTVQTSVPNTGTERVTPGSTQVQGKTYSDYEKLREANPTEYWSPRVQNEMFREIQAKGESFYND